jgi:hypothetical protein
MRLTGNEREEALSATLDELEGVLDDIGRMIPGASPTDLRLFKIALQNLDAAFRALLKMDLLAVAHPRLVSVPREE